jgi:hypothetical protein
VKTDLIWTPFGKDIVILIGRINSVKNDTTPHTTNLVPRRKIR